MARTLVAGDAVFMCSKCSELVVENGREVVEEANGAEVLVK